MASDVKVSLTIEGTDTAGKKTSTKIPYVNPNISNETMKTFAEMCAALSTDTHTGTTKTTEEDITNGGGGSLADGHYALNFFGSALADERVAAGLQTLNTKVVAEPFQGTEMYIGVNNLEHDNLELDITVTGYKPKNTTVTVDEGTITIEYPSDFTVTAVGNPSMKAMIINVPATNKFKAATLYQYFYLCDDDAEAI